MNQIYTRQFSEAGGSVRNHIGYPTGLFAPFIVLSHFILQRFKLLMLGIWHGPSYQTPSDSQREYCDQQVSHTTFPRSFNSFSATAGQKCCFDGYFILGYFA